MFTRAKLTSKLVLIPTFVVLTLVAVAIIVTLVLVLPKTEGNPGLELSVVHFNDFHARFEQTSTQSNTCTNVTECIGGIARLYTAIKRLKSDKPDSVLLNAGDNFQGTLWYNVFKWNVTQYFLNMMPSDAVTLGNHEFDDKIAGVVPFIKAITSPIIVTNIDDSLEPDMQGLYNKSVVIERDGKKIGIVGVILSTTNEIASTGNLKFLAESASVNAEADRLVAEEGVFTVIVLSHCGYDVEKQIAANATAKIGLVVGAHSHTFLYTGDNPPGPDTPYGEYPTVIEHEGGRKVLVVQASAYTKYLGNITVFYDENGEVSDWSGAPIFLENSIEPDETIIALLQPWKEVVDVQGTVVIGETLSNLDYTGRYTRECTLGNFVTDAFVYEYESQAGGTDRNYAAVVNAGGLRASIAAGNITYGDMVTAQPFENTVDTGVLQGKYIKELFESTTNEYYYGRLSVSVSLLQVSGIQLVYNLSNPQGERVTSIKMRCYECPQSEGYFEDLDYEKNYTMIIPSFLITGGDGYTVISENIRDHTVGATDIDIFVRYLKVVSPVNPKIEGRITFDGDVKPQRKYDMLV